jgi:PAS domain S-box-containing protein
MGVTDSIAALELPPAGRYLIAGDGRVLEAWCERADAQAPESLLTAWPGQERRLLLVLESAQRQQQPMSFEYSFWRGEEPGTQRITALAEAEGRAVLEVEAPRTGWQLREHLEVLSMVARHCSDVILVTEAEPLSLPGPRVLYVNPAFERMTGWSREDILGKTPRLLQGPGTDRAVLGYMRRCFEAWKPCRVELVNYRKDRSEFHVEIDLRPVTDEFGWYTHWIAIQREITDRRRAESSRQRASRMEAVGQLAGGLAHDFNNVLTSSVANLAYVREVLGTLQPEASFAEARAVLDEVQATLMGASGLARQLLSFSKGGEPLRHVVQLGPLLQRWAEFTLRGTSVTVETHVATDLGLVDADEGQLHQVFSNLLLNSRDASPEGNRISVRADNVNLELRPGQLGGPCVRISVQDWGSGIAPEHLERIFDPYFTTKPTGHGLGLAVCYSIIRKHGGLIEVESRQGEGTTFSVYLPVVPQELAQRTEPQPAVSPLPQGLRVLVMDDEAGIRNAVTRLLRRQGVHVDACAEGHAAVQLFQSQQQTGKPYHMVLLDLTIQGGMGGQQTLAALRELDPQVRAVMFTGYSDAVADEQAHGSGGFKAVLAKPFEPHELIRTLRSVLGGGAGG